MDARTYFDTIPAKVARARILRLTINAAGGPRALRPDAIRASGGTPGDPTSKACEAVEARRAELQAIEADLDEARAIVEGIRAGLGDKYADAIHGRYLKPPAGSKLPASYAVVGQRCGIERHTIMHRANVALDWLDSVGRARAIELSRGACPDVGTRAS